MKCPCAGNREFELFDGILNDAGQSLFVCSCCGTLKLLPEILPEQEIPDVPQPEIPPSPVETPTITPEIDGDV